VFNPLIVISAPNGARLSRSDHAALPITPTELADTAEALVATGVSVLHLHVRDEHDRHSLAPDYYRSAMTSIQDRVGDDLIIQITSEAVGIYDRHQQMQMVRELQPEAVSLALRELCPDTASEAEACDFFTELAERKCWIQFILYDAEDVRRFERLRVTGRLGRSDPFALFVLGRYTDKLLGNPDDLNQFMANSEHSHFPWAMCCFGHTESLAAEIACQNMGHIRIGFENNRQLPDGTIAADNQTLIKHTLDYLRKAGCQRPLASAQWIRENLR
jgi:3-keto-5-aminohexanoate cleavage enzyme